MPEGEMMGRRWMRAGALVLALGFDALGEPPAAWHPIVWFGRLIVYYDRWAAFLRQHLDLARLKAVCSLEE